MKTPYSKRTSINATGLCRIDKMAAMPFYDKKNLIKIFSRTRGSCIIGDSGTNKFVQILYGFT